MKNKTNNLSIILKIVATLCVIPLIFSSFFSGYKIGDTTVSMFEFVKQGNIFLTQAFISMVLQVLVILFLIFYGIVQTTNRKNERFIGTFLSIAQFVISIMAFVCVLIYCLTNAEKCIIGLSPIFYLVFGCVYATLMIVSYFIKDKNITNKKSSTFKKQTIQEQEKK